MTQLPPDDSHDTAHDILDSRVATVEHITIDADTEGQRLDVVLARALPGLSRARLQALIHAGAVGRADGMTIEGTSLRVKPGEVYVVHVPAAVDPEPKGEAIALDIVHEDKAVVVLNKPAGLVVHPATGHQTGTLVNALIAHCGASLSGIGGVRRPGIVHRLDKDTSGLLVVAKTDAAHQSLSEQFAAHGADGRLERGYAALVWGVLTPSAGRIATFIGRKAHDRTRMAVVREDHGRASATRYEVVQAFPGDAPTTLVRCTLETGRTHQVRVHMTHIGHPLLGDATYGTGFKTRIAKLGPKSQVALAALGRQALHAELLAFEHPTTGKPMRFEAKLPADMAALQRCLASGT